MPPTSVILTPARWGGEFPDPNHAKGSQNSLWEAIYALTTRASKKLASRVGETPVWPSWPILAPSWPILAPSWCQLGPSWCQHRPSWRQHRPSWRQLGRFWRQFGRSWRQFGRSWRQDGPKIGQDGAKIDANFFLNFGISLDF